VIVPLVCVFGLGKGIALRNVYDNKVFKELSWVFKQTEQVEKWQIYLAGEKSLVCLYGADADARLDTLRYRRFCENDTHSATRSTANIGSSEIPQSKGILPDYGAGRASREKHDS
jgi:hypothetical protein